MKKYNLLFITDERSKFDSNTKALDECFTDVVKVQTNDEALELIKNNTYDVILHDLSVEPEKVGVLKKIKEDTQSQMIFALVDPKDTTKLYGIADMGINAFELTPDQFDQALEMLSQYDPSVQQ
jgi:DNA-binding response OmpR family regulator